MKIISKSLVVITISIVIFLAGVRAAYFSTTKETSVDTANLILHDLSNNIKLVEMINNPGTDSTAIIIQQSKNIAELVATISVLGPKIEELDSISLESLCEVVKLAKNGIFDDPNIGKMRILAKDYLEKISGDVSRQISELQKSFKGKGCKIAI